MLSAFRKMIRIILLLGQPSTNWLLMKVKLPIASPVCHQFGILHWSPTPLWRRDIRETIRLLRALINGCLNARCSMLKGTGQSIAPTFVLGGGLFSIAITIIQMLMILQQLLPHWTEVAIRPVPRPLNGVPNGSWVCRVPGEGGVLLMPTMSIIGLSIFPLPITVP